MIFKKLIKFLNNKVYLIKFNILRLLRNVLEQLAIKQWNDYPLGKKIKAEKSVYLQLADTTKKINYPEIELYENNSGYQIDKHWIDDLALHTQVVIKKSKICYAHGRILYSALSKYINENRKLNNVNILETGTARGFSSLCMAKALEDNNKEGTIITFDVLPHDTKMFWNCIDDHDGPKSRRELLYPWNELVERYIIFHQGDTRIEMKKIKTDRIHFAFLDGFHTFQDVYSEFDQIKNNQRSGDIIVFDDYTPHQYPGLVKAVDDICKNYNYKITKLQSSNNRGYLVGIKR